MASCLSSRERLSSPFFSSQCRRASGRTVLAAAASVAWRRRAPLVGAFCVLSLGAISALTSRSGSAFSQALFPTSLWSKVTYRNPVEGIRSIRMDSSSATVPYIVVYVTVPNKDAGKKLSESIIQEKLAACVNRVPGVESLYWWDGKVQTDSEELLIIKTRESLLKDLEQHVKANHEYENPEVIALPIIGGSAEYLGWIKNSTKDD